MLHKKELTYKNSKIKILCDNKKAINFGIEEIKKQRIKLEEYIKNNPELLKSLKPVKAKDNAPKIAKQMAEASKIAGIGPMSAVAGTISELVSKKIKSKGGKNIIVENGGDIFLITEKPVVIGVFSGTKVLKNIGILVQGELAICSSSSKMGHSYSEGKCDLATVFSKNGSVADSVATASCNKIKNEDDLKNTLDWAIKKEGVDGIISIINGKLGMIGNIPKLIKAEDKNLKEKITKFDFYKF